MLEGFSVARTASPWFWEERNGWYINKDGQRHFLGEHPADAPPPRKTKKKWNAPPDILRAFQASARTYGCSTEQLDSEFSADILGERRSYYGVSASCGEGTIALLTLDDGRVSVGCVKPTKREACSLLLRNISQAR